jgi:long-chain acyl-CoA synthetase
MLGYHQLTTNDVHLSYLPIPHSYERFNIFACVFYGANIRYAKHPITELTKDLAIVRPTLLPLVPRLLNKFYPMMKALSDK